MHILYAGMKYDYGDASRGLSFEHHNFYDSLARSEHQVTYFDFMTEFQQRGKAAMSARLVDIVRSEKPDLLFCVLYTDEFEGSAIETISRKTDTVSFNWFCDDHWRFEGYSQYWAPLFNWVSTTAVSAIPKYARIGCSNVLKTQWACNHYLYRKLDVSPKYDVTFVGQPHGSRVEMIEKLRRAGVNVETWGYGWPRGRLEQEEMIGVFNQSKINLNLSNASVSAMGSGLRRLLPPSRRHSSQIKGRNFEIPGCGGFLLTDVAENLDEYYAPDLEVGTFQGSRDLLRRVERYLNDSNLRSEISQAGYDRTLAEHTYRSRFAMLFSAMGFGT